MLSWIRKKLMEFNKKIALVNVLFPPFAMGGATRVVLDEARILSSKYNADVIVFTSFINDIDAADLYKMRVYTYENIRVYGVFLGLDSKTNWQPQDSKVKKLFSEFIELEQPDVVHFHCIQVLSGSVVESAIENNIPYYVTIHDAWWISDFQFLVDDKGVIYPEGHPDPFASLNLPEYISPDDSILRKVYLKGLLLRAHEVFVVSDCFKNIIYNSSGINCIVIPNGISNISWKKKNTSYTENVVCGFVGGISEHKGFDIFKNAVKSLAHNTKNIEVIIVDHRKPYGYFHQARWNNIEVKIYGQFDLDNVSDLYCMIDVLFAPSIWPESFGLVTREAVACGCWVVASNVGAIGEDVSDYNGMVISPSVSQIKMALVDISRNVKKFKALSNSIKIRYSSDQVDEYIKYFSES